VKQKNLLILMSGEHSRLRSRSPWVLFVPFASPHFPLTVPVKYTELYRDPEIPSPFGYDEATRPRHSVMDAMREFWNYTDFFDTDGGIDAVRWMPSFNHTPLESGWRVGGPTGSSTPMAMPRSPAIA